jgi:cob(I)alamin adenosyltransferase
VPLLKEEEISEVAYKYVNRLSDYLFMLARYCAQAEGKKEVIYKKERKELPPVGQKTDENEAEQ